MNGFNSKEISIQQNLIRAALVCTAKNDSKINLGNYDFDCIYIFHQHKMTNIYSTDGQISCLIQYKNQDDHLDFCVDSRSLSNIIKVLNYQSSEKIKFYHPNIDNRSMMDLIYIQIGKVNTITRSKKNIPLKKIEYSTSEGNRQFPKSENFLLNSKKDLMYRSCDFFNKLSPKENISISIKQVEINYPIQLEYSCEDFNATISFITI